ncbi:MAG TPA: Gfo/Idh/MocA family oxidoreductase [Planctomycetota bacterium]|nr:Gfo/Idh/MocA family oxidoreductase [Planctomycetota bacterium]
MSQPLVSRRDFLRTTAAATALSAAHIPDVHAAGGDTVQVALVGCGGRGTGAAADALSSKGGDVRLVAMADVLQNRLNSSHKGLANEFKDQVKVPEEARFIGFDAYKKAIDLLGKGDVVILTTPCGFRPLMFKYAIEKGVNVFMEKPLTVDGPSSRRMLDLSKEADAKGIKVGVGLMVRHCKGRQELYKRIRDGEIGDITSMRAYRMHPAAGSPFSSPRPASEKSELIWQIKRFHSFIWASGGLFSDYYIHQIDECCWMKDAWPVKAEGVGGRQFRGDNVDQNFDNYAVEFSFEDGTKFHYYGRHIIGAPSKFFSGVHGTKGSAVVSLHGHTPGEVRTFKSQSMEDKDLIWAFPPHEPNPYRTEWQDLMDAIRTNTPYNEVPRGVKASLVTSMGRMAAHTGETITYDHLFNSNWEAGAGINEFTGPESDPPVKADANGRYPIPEPGQKKDREY